MNVLFLASISMPFLLSGAFHMLDSFTHAADTYRLRHDVFPIAPSLSVTVYPVKSGKKTNITQLAKT